MARSSPSRSRRGNAPEAVRARIRTGDLSPLYLLHGPEDLEKEDLLRELVDAAVPPEARTFNLDVFRAEDLDVSETVTRVSAFPMLAARRMVVIKRADRLPEAATRELLPFVQSPSQTSVLAFTADKVDGRKKFFSELQKNAVCIEFKTPYENEIPDWIRRRAEALGKRIDPEAVHLLQMSVGVHLRELAQELEKLDIYTENRETITREDVAWVVSASRGATVFELADAVGRRQPGPALQRLGRLVEQGENPVGIVAMLARHIAILRKARWLQGHRLSRSEMASRLKVPPFFVQNYVDQASRFDDRTLWEAWEALLEADNRLKSRSRTPMVTLSELVCRLCKEPAQKAAPSP